VTVLLRLLQRPMAQGAMLLVLLLALLQLPALSTALRRVVSAEYLSSFEIPRGTTVNGALFPVGGLSGLASDGATIYAVSDRGDIFTATASVSDAGLLAVELQGAFHVGVAGGNADRPAYVDAEGIAVCGGQQGPAGALLVSTEDPPRVFRLNRADGSAWAEATPLPVRLQHIVNASSTRRNGQLESLSCWSDTGPDGQAAGSWSGTIFTANEAPLQQDSEPQSLWDGGAVGSSVRIFSIDRSSGSLRRTTRYRLDRRSGNGLVDVEAVGPGGSLITMERAFEYGAGNTIRIFAVDSVTEVGDAGGCTSLSEASGCAAAVPKRLLLDIGATAGMPLDNFEGMALLGTPLADGRRVLLLVNDDNYSPGQLPTTFVAVALTEEDDLSLPNLGTLTGTTKAAVVTPLPEGSVTPSSSATELTTAFRGIPYALPPVGHRRFAAPEPYDQSFPAGTGLQHGAACPQTQWLSYYGPEPTSEDCLFLNVFTPTSSAADGRCFPDGSGRCLPVLVFVHGGSWLWGSSSVFDGTHLYCFSLFYNI